MTVQNIYNNLLEQAEKLFRHNRQGSYKTRLRYKEGFRRFLQYLAEHYRTQRLANISPEHFKSYAQYMQLCGKSASTIKTDLAAIRFWHDQIPNAKHKLPPNSELDLEKRQFGGVDRTWSLGEYNKMVALAWKASREDIAACIAIAWHTGLRIHEVVKIDTAAARRALKARNITIRGKGGRVRDVELDEAAADELRRWLKRTRPGYKLFVPKEKQSHQVIREIQDFIREYRDEAGDEEREARMTFHGTRHSYAARQYEQMIHAGRGDLGTKLRVSQNLGHGRADVTNLYLASLSKKKTPPKGGGGDV
ncbi:tyrosine-type recombinase/integrase [Ruminococcaceae bacterium OttesenSCG-928-A11]|nr:tyrosine-type recombinase/integrase [Ruminococcaceae bacterium OttesenSCG-928-A11]